MEILLISFQNSILCWPTTQSTTARIAKNAIKDLGASLKNVVGGELKSYTELLSEAREEALKGMVAQAKKLKANAIVNVRFATSSITAGAAEVYAYGTAIEVANIEG